MGEPAAERRPWPASVRSVACTVCATLCATLGRMARKKRTQVFSKTKAVKSAARQAVGTPPPTREIPDAKSRQRRRAAKHKPTMGDLISGE